MAHSLSRKVKYPESLTISEIRNNIIRIGTFGQIGNDARYKIRMKIGMSTRSPRRRTWLCVAAILIAERLAVRNRAYKR